MLPLLFLGRRSHFQQQTFLISSFISHSLFHFSKIFFSTHICGCSLTPYLWVIIDLLDPSLPSISFCSAGLNFTLSSRPLEVSQYCCCCSHSLHCALYHPVQHVSSSTRSSSYSSISHSFDIVVSIVCCCNSNPLSRKSSSNTFTHSFHRITTTSKEVQFYKWQRKGLSGS